MKSKTIDFLKQLPNHVELKRICKAVSALEAIICQDWENRYFSFQKEWDTKVELCEIRDGSGDHILIFFTENGAFINGLLHEVGEPTNGTCNYISLPKFFQKTANDAVVKDLGTTFYLWQTDISDSWTIGEDSADLKDIKVDLLSFLDGDPITFNNWAKDYYELYNLDLNEIKKVYEGDFLSKDLINKINPSLTDFETLSSDLKEIGYDHEI